MAVGLAREGADIIAIAIIAIDIAAPVEASIAPSATLENLEETVRLAENLNRRIYSAQADVRDYDKPKFALDQGVAELGRLDIVVANAGLWSSSPGSRPSMPWASPGSNRRTSRTRSSGSHPTKPAT